MLTCLHPESSKDFDELCRLANGDASAFELLWNSLYPRLVAIVERRISPIPRLRGKAEDIASISLFGFLRKFGQGEFPGVVDSESLWKLLRSFAIRSIHDHRRIEMAKKRGGDLRIVLESGMSNEGSMEVSESRSRYGSDPGSQLELSESFNFLLGDLPDDFHRDVVLLRIQGASTMAISEMLRCSSRTIQRALCAVLQRWQVLF